MVARPPYRFKWGSADTLRSLGPYPRLPCGGKFAPTATTPHPSRLSHVVRNPLDRAPRMDGLHHARGGADPGRAGLRFSVRGDAADRHGERHAYRHHRGTAADAFD